MSEKRPQRFLALDVFRGLTIFFMIVVNTPGSWSFVYAPLQHAKWDGLTPTDLVFPFFVFIIGVAMAYSFRKFDASNRMTWYIKILRRTALIFLLGLLLNAFPFYNQTISELRIFGVLQRIALAYGFAALVVMHCPRVGVPVAFVVLLILYYGILLGFGGESPLTLEDNLVRKIDLWLVGEAHVYQGYGLPFDPEGLLSTLPTVGTALFGYWIGLLIQSKIAMASKLKSLSLYALIATGLSIVWHFTGCPINKPIWSSSYVLVTGGLATGTLVVLLLLIDAMDWQNGTGPVSLVFRGFVAGFEAFGKNPLACYVLSIALIKLLAVIKVEGQGVYGWVYVNFFQANFGNYAGSCLQAISYALLIFCFAWLLYRKGIVIKI